MLFTSQMFAYLTSRRIRLQSQTRFSLEWKSPFVLLFSMISLNFIIDSLRNSFRYDYTTINLQHILLPNYCNNKMMINK